MMILRNSLPSPFARKIRIGASLVGLADQIKFEPADAMNPADTLRQQNPIGKLPVLILEDGTAIYDSPVIIEYLDHRAGGDRLIPRDPKQRFAALTLQALCDGLLDALLLLVYEGRFRAEDRREQKWTDHQSEKIKRAMTMLEKTPPSLEKILVGQITLACALGYQDLRFQGAWRKSYPGLVAWLDDFASRVPAFAETRAEA
ncbi:MAG: glutathione S-transferase family protein [Pseudorhodoplanes sp.]